ncbi:hypothetical protein GMST_23460 [Geomonas silvestris]|uniref:Uncharacterized protein n=1 Tax=Geomonas silvestris TaxID=2740184 RepID=A0A6V8MJ63_9BACT|nr:hypothetical protein [Geomonas silvestris]GFO60021.1 hypothetical protein GMST_23460 [Geomonas silvestris]
MKAINSELPSSARCLDRRLTVRLDGDRFAALERIAQTEGFNASVIVRHLVYRFIAEKQRYSAVRG